MPGIHWNEYKTNCVMYIWLKYQLGSPLINPSTRQGHCAYIRPTAEINARARNNTTSFEIYLSFLILPLGCGKEAMYKDKG